MADKRSKARISLAIYLFVVGVLFCVFFAGLASVQPYIDRGVYTRIQSCLDDALSMENVEKYISQPGYHAEMKTLTESITLIAVRTRAQVSSNMAYLKTALFLGAVFYMLTGWSVYRRSDKFKVFFSFGVLSWILWLSVFSGFAYYAIQMSNDSLAALNGCAFHLDNLTGPVPGVEIIRYPRNRFFILSVFVICVALPGFMLELYYKKR